jgi:hypothetical protein
MRVPARTPHRNLTEQELRAWNFIYQKAAARGIWRSEYAAGLYVLAALCSAYVDTVRRYRSPGFQPPRSDDLIEREKRRLLIREQLSAYGVIDHDRVHLASINAEGLDSDIAAVCAPNTLPETAKQ